MKLLKIGRNADNDIVLNSSMVSGNHAEIILLNNGDILLIDQNSTNGTFVGNKRIQPTTDVSIKRGDVVRFADTELSWSQVPNLEDPRNYSKMIGIGSNFRNEVQVPGNTVSRFHATLKVDKHGRTFIEDHSLNGTTVNGKRIASHQNIRVKHGDAVAVGGIPIDLKAYINRDTLGTLVKVLGGLAVLALLVLVITQFANGNWSKGKNPSVKMLAQATPIVYGAYFVDVILKDDPFVGLIADWPEKWQFGIDGSGNLTLSTGTGMHAEPIQFSGTAFFISENGEMGTNRHIAVPWEYLTKPEINDIRQQMQLFIGSNGIGQDVLNNILINAIRNNEISLETAIAYVERFSKSDYEISGHFEYLGVVLPGHNVSTLSDLMSCQVIADSGDPEKDVALIRLNSQQTPEFIVKDGFYQMRNARLDELKLDLDEQLKVIGYPGGVFLGFKASNGDALQPTIHNTTISKMPDNNDFQIQSVGLGGQSGSPVIDAKGNLVGVFYSGIAGNEISYCCNIKHLAELFDKYKVRR